MKQWFLKRMRSSVPPIVEEIWLHYKRMLDHIGFMIMQQEKKLHPAWGQGARAVLDILEGDLIPEPKGIDWKEVVTKVLLAEYDDRLDELEGAPWENYGVNPDEKAEIIKEIKSRAELQRP